MLSRKEFKKKLDEEMKVYDITNENIKQLRFRHEKNYLIWQAVKNLRKYEFACMLRNNCKNSLSARIRSYRKKIACRRMNKSFEKIDVELSPFMIGENIRICHSNIVIYGYVGNNCTFHGDNVVGNKRTGAHSELPKIGNNVDIGYGAIIIGNVEIADNCVIGAGAVVTKSFTEKGSIIVGVPARTVKNVK